MIDRRELLLSGAALGAGAGASFLPPFRFAAAAVRSDGAGRLALYDDRLEDAAGFRAAVLADGRRPVPLSGDIAAMLYGPLGSEAFGEKRGTFGLTTYADFVVATGIARERGGRLAGAVLRERQTTRLIGGSAGELARHAGGPALARFLSGTSGRQTTVFWAVA